MSRMCWLHNPFYISWFLFSILPFITFALNKGARQTNENQ